MTNYLVVGFKILILNIISAILGLILYFLFVGLVWILTALNILSSTVTAVIVIILYIIIDMIICGYVADKLFHWD